MLKLKLKYFDHLMQKTDSSEKTLMMGKIEGRRRRGRASWMASPTQWIWVWVNSRSWWWTGWPGMLQSMGLQRAGHDWVTELNWTDWSSVDSHFWKCEISVFLENHDYWLSFIHSSRAKSSKRHRAWQEAVHLYRHYHLHCKWIQGWDQGNEGSTASL